MQKPIRILYIDDSKTDRELVKDTFNNDKNKFEVVAVSNRADFEENLKKYEYDLVLSDFNILGLDGFQVFDIVKSVNNNIPIVVITGTGSEESAVELMKRGVADYVIKSPSHIQKLPYIVQAVLEKKQMLTKQEEMRINLIISLEKYKVLFGSFPLGITITDKEGNIIETNRKSEQLLGISYDEHLARKYDGAEWKIIRPDGSIMPAEEYASVRAAKENKLIENVEMGILKDNNTTTWINVTAAPIPLEDYGVAITYNDITRRKIEEDKNILVMKIFELLNQSLEKTEIIHNILMLIKNYTGFEAVGIRLKQGEDYPYYETNGFPHEFVELERSLCERDPDGKIIRDPMGNPFLECMCGNIIAQRIDPSLPFFTKGGSFWTNSSTELLTQTTETERLTRTRNRCNAAGYESVGLIPLKSKDEIIGLLQMNDHRKNMFTPEMIVFFEGIGNSIGIAIMQKMMMETIRKNEERINLAFEATSDAIWDRNFSTRESFFSPRYYEILGYELGEFPSSFDGWKKLVHPDDIDKLNTVLLNASENVKPNYEMEFRMRTKNREWIWISSHFKVVERDKDGKSVRLIGTISDITKHKLSDFELHKNIRALKVLSECNKRIVLLKDENLLIQNICSILVNVGGYALAWVGYKENDLNKSVIPAAWAGEENDYLKTVKISWAENERGRGPTGVAIRTGKVCVVRDVKSDQNFIPWLGEALKRGFQSMIALPLKENDHTFGTLQILSSLVNAFDKAEIDLLSEVSNDLSYGIISIRTRKRHDQLENELLQSQKMEAIGRLAGGIAHDFNNILTVIMGNSEILLSETNDEKSIKIIEQVKLSAKKAASLTHQLLAFSRKQMIKPKILDLNLIVQELRKMLARMIGEDIDLIIIPDKNLKRINADQGQIDQIIMNLAVNAKDAMPNGGKLTIKTENVFFEQTEINNNPDFQPGQYVCIQISDTGSGIPDDVLSQIFEPFFSTKELGKGTGLGLSVVYGIVKQNLGWISIATRHDEGTSFNIFLPAIDEEIADDNKIKNDRELFKGNGEDILILEDDLEIRNLVCGTLSRQNYTIHQARDLKEALKIFGEMNGEFDLLFSDIVLPDGSGIEFYEKLLGLNQNLKVLFTSGYADEKARWSIIQKKQYDFIQKPYETIDLLKAVYNKIHSDLIVKN